MHKKLVMACMALAAFAAFVVPSVASAANTPLLVEGSTAVEAGKLIEAKNTEILKMTTSLGSIECTTGILTGRVHRNITGTAVEGEITSAKIGGTGALQSGAAEPECTTQAFLGADTTITPSTAVNGLPWCLGTAGLAEDEFRIAGGACTSSPRPIRFALDITEIGTCQYQKTAAISGTFTTSDDSVLSISEQEFSGSGLGNPFGCPGSGKLDMKFTMVTDGTNTALGLTK